MCVKYLHRLPSEVPVLPIAYAELAALEELDNPERPICTSCRREWLLENLEVSCELCGKTFIDPQRKQQLTSK